VVASNDHGASSGPFALLDEINLVQTFPFVGSFQLLSQVVITDTSRVDDGIGREDILRETPFYDKMCREIYDALQLPLPHFGQLHQRHM
jgi:hypothetical protein